MAAAAGGGVDAKLSPTSGFSVPSDGFAPHRDRGRAPKRLLHLNQ